MPRSRNEQLLAIGASVQMTKLRVLLMSAPERQYQIAAKLGIAPSKLSTYAHGAEIPRHHILPLCQYFHCNPEDLIGWTEL